jgi:hypothetical protein
MPRLRAVDHRFRLKLLLLALVLGGLTLAAYISIYFFTLWPDYLLHFDNSLHVSCSIFL